MTDFKDRRKAIPFEQPLSERMAQIEDRLFRGSERMDLMADELAENTKVTTEVRDLLAAGKGGLKVLGWLGTFAKWISALVGGLVSLYVLVYALTHGGQLPHK